jgi:hypothetical protein
VERVDRFSEEFNLIPKYLSPPPLNWPALLKVPNTAVPE